MEQTNYNTMRDTQGYFKFGERERMFEACKNDRDRILIRLLWKSGRRIGEILQLKVKDIDFENGLVFWHIEKKRQTDKKTGLKVKFDKVSPKPQDTDTLKLLGELISKYSLNPEWFLFQSIYKIDRPMTRQRAFQIVRKCALLAGVNAVGCKKPHPHHFRHSWAIEMAKKLQSPADMRKLQIFLEHNNLGVTEQYLMFNVEDMRSLMED